MKNISGWVGMHNKQEPLWVLVQTGVLRQQHNQFNLVNKSYCKIMNPLLLHTQTHHTLSMVLVSWLSF